MRIFLRLAYLWPGFAQVWRGGRWIGLGEAIIFSIVINLAVISTFLWPEWLDPSTRTVFWLIAGCIWVVSAYRSLKWLRSRQDCQNATTEQVSDDRGATAQIAPVADLFLAAQTQYLRGQWFETESLLQELLSIRPKDIDAHLFLATLYRHRRRFDEARRQVRTLERLEGAGKWSVEIYDEQKHLARLSSNAPSPVGLLANTTSGEPQRAKPEQTPPIAKAA